MNEFVLSDTVVWFLLCAVTLVVLMVVIHTIDVRRRLRAYEREAHDRLRQLEHRAVSWHDIVDKPDRFHAPPEEETR